MATKHSTDSYFQMPLHYPRYSRTDYLTMPEWQLDRLLAEYGLLGTATADLAAKREFAMGAFLWPDFPDQVSYNSNTGNCCKKSKVAQLLGRVLGFA